MEGYEMPDWMDLDRMILMKNRMQEEALFGDGEEFPAESPDAFSDAPLSFEELTGILQEDLEELYEMTATLNRYSPEYKKVCKQMEELIRHLGSCCVTKAVLEQNGFEFPKLQDLDLHDLYGMVSFNIRKSRTAYLDGKRLKNCADTGLLQLNKSLAVLALQMNATENKIRQIREGKIDTAKMLERVDLYVMTPETKVQKEKKERRAAAAKARALPVIGSVARQMIAERKAEERAEREEERAQQESLRSTFGTIQPFGAPAIFRPSKSMMELANRDEIPDMVQKLYDPPGPSEATRKKLRNKRKKKK